MRLKNPKSGSLKFRDMESGKIYVIVGDSTHEGDLVQLIEINGEQFVVKLGGLNIWFNSSPYNVEEVPSGTEVIV